jgi:hypothetical protein
VDLTVLLAVARRVADEDSSADDSVPILEAVTEIERLRVQLAEADAIVFLVDANMRGHGAFPIPFGEVRACLDRHQMRVSGNRRMTPASIGPLPNRSNNRPHEMLDEGAHTQPRSENLAPRPISPAEDDQVN